MKELTGKDLAEELAKDIVFNARYGAGLGSCGHVDLSLRLCSEAGMTDEYNNAETDYKRDEVLLSAAKVLDVDNIIGEELEQ